MTLGIEEIARAISGHRFREATPYLTDDITWTVVGAETLIGKDAVVDACEASAAYLADVATKFRLFRVVVGIQSDDGIDTVVVDTLADYTDAAAEKTTVRSVDLYDFDEGMLTAIVSYNVELAG